MSGFLYFIEGKKSAPSEILDAAGLSHALSPGAVTTCESTKGPGKKAGTTAAVAGTEPALVKYAPKRQTWAPIENGGGPGAWLGYYTEDPPGPMDLLRPDAILDGYAVALEAIGRPDEWFIPRGRIYAEDAEHMDCDFPQGLKMIDGAIVKNPLPRFRQACLDAERIWAAVMTANSDRPEKDRVVLTPAEEFQLAVRILGINYRVSTPEVNALEILTTDSMTQIVKCFVDFPAYFAVEAARAEAKKNDADADTPVTEDSNFGPPAG